MRGRTLVAFLLTLALSVAYLLAAITYGTVTDHNGAPGTSTTISYTSSSGSDRLLLVCTGVRDPTLGDRRPSGVTYGGNALTEVGTGADDGAIVSANLWYLLDTNFPAPGASDVVVTHGGNTANSIHHIVQIDGVDQTTAVEDNDTATGNSTAFSVTTTPLTNGAEAVSCGMTGNDSVTFDEAAVGNSETVRGEVIYDTNTGHLMSFAVPTAQATTLDATLSASTNWAAIAVALKPASTGLGIPIVMHHRKHGE